MNQDPTANRLFLSQCGELLEQCMVKIRHCLARLATEQIWWRPRPDQNSIGNLCLHLAGNLRQWTVCGVGGLPDDRDRASEFTANHPLPGPELLEQLESRVVDARQLFDGLDPTALTGIRTIQGFEVTVLQAILHTTSHFVGHTHQIILLTRLILGDEYRFQWTPQADRGSIPI